MRILLLVIATSGYYSLANAECRIEEVDGKTEVVCSGTPAKQSASTPTSSYERSIAKDYQADIKRCENERGICASYCPSSGGLGCLQSCIRAEATCKISAIDASGATDARPKELRCKFEYEYCRANCSSTDVACVKDCEGTRLQCVTY